MHDYTHHHTLVNEARLHHLKWQGGSPTVVYLPGFIATAYGALHLARALVPHRRVLALDLRGRGESAKPPGPYGFETHMADLSAWMDALHLEDVILAGHSFGALLAGLFASTYPERVQRVIWFDGGVPPAKAALNAFMAYHSNLTYEYPSVEAYVATYRQLPGLQPWTPEAESLTRANVTEQADGSARRVVPPHVVEAELRAFSHTQQKLLKEAYTRLTHPILLIQAGMGSFGPGDQHIPSKQLEQLRQQLPQLQVYQMPQAGHTGVLTIPDRGRDAAIRAFVGVT